MPGNEILEGEELVVDNSAYEMLHQMGVEWPCLSFDRITDKLGGQRNSVRTLKFGFDVSSFQ